MNGTRRQGAYAFRGSLQARPTVLQRFEPGLVSLLCVLMAFAGGYLLGSCIA